LNLDHIRGTADLASAIPKFGTDVETARLFPSRSDHTREKAGGVCLPGARLLGGTPRSFGMDDIARSPSRTFSTEHIDEIGAVDRAALNRAS